MALRDDRINTVSKIVFYVVSLHSSHHPMQPVGKLWLGLLQTVKSWQQPQNSNPARDSWLAATALDTYVSQRWSPPITSHGPRVPHRQPGRCWVCCRPCSTTLVGSAPNPPKFSPSLSQIGLAFAGLDPPTGPEQPPPAAIPLRPNGTMVFCAC